MKLMPYDSDERRIQKIAYPVFSPGPQDDLFPEILRDEPVARPRLYELGKNRESYPNMDGGCWFDNVRSSSSLMMWMSMRASKLKWNNNELFLVALCNHVKSLTMCHAK
ncbi:hypothetical protein LXL04_003794 [Taraxacum kok-saghyz]